MIIPQYRDNLTKGTVKPSYYRAWIIKKVTILVMLDLSAAFDTVTTYDLLFSTMERALGLHELNFIYLVYLCFTFIIINIL